MGCDLTPETPTLIGEWTFIQTRSVTHRTIMDDTAAALDKLPDDALERGCVAFSGVGKADWRHCFLAYALPAERKADGRMDSWGPVEARLAILDWFKDMGLTEADMNAIANAFDLFRVELAEALSRRLCHPVPMDTPAPSPSSQSEGIWVKNDTLDSDGLTNILEAARKLSLLEQDAMNRAWRMDPTWGGSTATNVPGYTLYYTTSTTK